VPAPKPEYPLAINLRTANVQAINRQAQADVAGENAQRFHARREELLRLQRYVRLYGCLPPKTQIAGGDSMKPFNPKLPSAVSARTSTSAGVRRSRWLACSPSSAC